MSGQSRWVDLLKNYVSSKPKRSAQEIDDETDTLFLKYMQEMRIKDQESHPSLKKIPRFHQKSTNISNQLHFKVRQEARTRFLHHKTSEILDKEGLFLLTQIWKNSGIC